MTAPSFFRRVCNALLPLALGTVAAHANTNDVAFTAQADASVGLGSRISANSSQSISLTGTEAALSSYLSSANQLSFNGSAGSYSLTVSVQTISGSISAQAAKPIRM